MSRRTREQVIHDLEVKIQSRGGILRSNYIDSKTNIKIECSNGHIWETRAASIMTNNWCRECSGKTKNAACQKINNIAESNGGKVIGEYINTRTYIEVECQYGHRWNVKPNRLTQGDWCPVCANHCPIAAREKFYNVVAWRGGQVLGDYYDTITNIRIRCEHGHEWTTKPKSISSDMHWCPACSNQCPIQSMNKFCNIVATKGGKIKGDYYNTDTKILLECDKGHEWNVKPSSIINDTWCPHCNKSKGEMNIMLTLKKYNIHYVEQYPLEEYLFKKKYDFLIQYDNKYYFIEYDGEQHFEHNLFFFKTEEEFKMRQQIDIIKNQVAIMLGYGIIRIDYNELNNIEQHIINALNIGQQQYYSTPSMYYHMNDTVDNKLWMEHVKPSYWDYLKNIGY